jgi:nanoRNase/pAp phosphatase (c-di-AMP/oligoRNAs hydrolase)
MKVDAFPFKKETELNFNKLMEMVQPDDSLLLLMHGSPDPDAIASAMALREIIQRTKGLSKSAFVSTEPLIRQQNIEFVSSLRLY